MAKKETVKFPNPAFWKCRDNIDWKAQGENLMEVMGIFGDMLKETDWKAFGKKTAEDFKADGRRLREEYEAVKNMTPAERLELLKNGEKDNKKAFDVLNVYKETLENFGNARDAKVAEEDRKFVQDIQLLTAKPIIYVCNVDDESATTGNKYSDTVKAALKEGQEMVVVAGKLEAEIAELDADDRQLFMEDAGLTEPGVNKLVRTAYHTLNLHSFFTTGPDETRAWTIHVGDTAPIAAGAIHSDLQRGFIRAEVMSTEDFLQYGSEAAVKEAGKFRVEGKTYVVQDGDILNIRFNV